MKLNFSRLLILLILLCSLLSCDRQNPNEINRAESRMSLSNPYTISLSEFDDIGTALNLEIGDFSPSFNIESIKARDMTLIARYPKAWASKGLNEILIIIRVGAPMIWDGPKTTALWVLDQKNIIWNGSYDTEAVSKAGSNNVLTIYMESVWKGKVPFRRIKMVASADQSVGDVGGLHFELGQDQKDALYDFQLQVQKELGLIDEIVKNKKFNQYIEKAVKTAFEIKNMGGMIGLISEIKKCYNNNSNQLYCVYLDIASRHIDNLVVMGAAQQGEIWPKTDFFEDKLFSSRIADVYMNQNMTKEAIKAHTSEAFSNITKLVEDSILRK